MDNGITAAQQFNLQPGIALTSAQMAALTSDIVWLVQKEVTLADGSKQKVLAPQVYARLKEGDIDGSGALLSGNTLDLNLSGDLVNSGTLAGRSVVALTADNLQNLNGRISGGDVQVAARTDLANLGGIIDAQTRLNVSAGRDLTVASTTARNQNAQGSITHLDRIAGLYVADGSLAASAGRDLTLTAAQVVNSGTQSGEAGQTTLVAGRDLNLNTVTTASQNNLAWNANNWRKDASSQEIGAAIQSQGNIQLAAGNDLNARAASVTSDQGALKVTALNNVTISAGQSTQFVDEKHQSTSKGFLSSKTISTRDTLDQTQAQASTFSGQTVTVQAGNDLTVRGSNVVGTGDVSLLAGNNVTIDAATNRFSQTHLKDVKQSGLLSANGGIGFTIGTRQQTDTTQSQGTTQSQSRSLIGSTDGSLTISAGKDATIRGSDLAAGQDLNVSAQRILIDPGQDVRRTVETHEFKQSGLTVAVSSPVLSAAQTAYTMGKMVGEAKDGRVKALAGVTAGLAAKNGYDAYQSMTAPTGNTGAGTSGAAQGNTDNKGGSNAVTVSITYGKSQSTSQTTTDSATHSGSTLRAGNNLNLTATGAGKESTLAVIGSDLTAGNNATLKADGDIHLVSAQDTTTQKSTNNASSWGAGVAITYGNGKGAIGFTANGSLARGGADGSDVVNQNTHVTAGNTLNLQSGNDTHLKGAVASAQTVNADVGGNLNLESRQDTSKYKSKDQNISGSVTIGYGFSGSASAGQQKIDSDYASVIEQTGIKAGNGGFNLNVKGNTNLKGAVIDSTASADKNTLTTGTLTTRDLQNKAEYSASSIQIGGGGGMSMGSGSGLQTFNTGASAATPIALFASGNDSSSTRTAIANGTVKITDTAGQQQKTGQTAEQAVASLNRDTANAHHAIGNNLDKEAIDQAFTVTKAFIQESSTFLSNRAAEADALKQKRDAVTDKNSSAYTDLNNQYQEAAKWSPGGEYGRIATVLQTAVGGNVTGGMTNLVQNAVVGYVQSLGAEKVKEIADSFMKKDEAGKLQQTTESENVRAALHAIVACAGAAATQQSCGSAATGAAGSVVLNNLLGGDPEKMSASEKEARKNLVGTLIIGLAAGTGQNAATANAAAQIEMENNALAVPIIVIEGITITARACATNPVCRAKAIEVGINLAALVAGGTLGNILEGKPAEPVAPPPPLVTPAEAQKIFGPPPFESQEKLAKWLGNVLEGQPIDERQKWAGEFVTTLPAIQRAVWTDFIYESVTGDTKGSRLPVPDVTKSGNGLDYQSNPKHTLGEIGNRQNAGLEPKNSLQLFEQSVPSTKTYDSKEVRYSMDSDGNIHRFEAANGVFHWNGSTGDANNPLNSSKIPIEIKRAFKFKG